MPLKSSYVSRILLIGRRVPGCGEIADATEGRRVLALSGGLVRDNTRSKLSALESEDLAGLTASLAKLTEIASKLE